MKTYHILLIGAGQIGSRHLQALGLSDLPINISVVDTTQTSLLLAKKRYEQVCKKNNVQYYSELTFIENEVDFCIIATNAANRLSVLKCLLANVVVKYILLEKILFQTNEQIDEAYFLLEKYRVNTWVNCPRRMYPIYQKLKAMLANERFISLKVYGEDWGLTCNAIHFIDLWAYLSGNTSYSLDTNSLSTSILQSKRVGYKELSGTLIGSNTVDDFSLTCLQGKGAPKLYITVESENYCIEINESKCVCKIRNVLLDSEEIISFSTIYQSELTHVFVRMVLLEGLSPLTPYIESAALHGPFLQGLLNFFNQHDSVPHMTCPIT